MLETRTCWRCCGLETWGQAFAVRILLLLLANCCPTGSIFSSTDSELLTLSCAALLSSWRRSWAKKSHFKTPRSHRFRLPYMPPSHPFLSLLQHDIDNLLHLIQSLKVCGSQGKKIDKIQAPAHILPAWPAPLFIRQQRCLFLDLHQSRSLLGS